MTFKVPESCRLQKGAMRSDPEDGNNGFFILIIKGKQFACMASDGMGWEHVSVSRPDRCPTWEEMCVIKSRFWDSEEDCVIQYHPPKSEYVNNHPYCLHLWRPTEMQIPIPSSYMVGLR